MIVRVQVPPRAHSDQISLFYTALEYYLPLPYLLICRVMFSFLKRKAIPDL